MKSVKKRAALLAACLLLSILMVCAMWLDNAFSPRTEEGMEQRRAKQYMLTDFQLVAEGTAFDRVYKSGEELALFDSFSRLVFYPLEGRAAFFPGTVVFWSPESGDDPDCRAMELYAYDEVEGAVRVELEFWLRDEASEGGEIFEATYTPACTGYAEGLATFLLAQSQPDQREFEAFNALSTGAVFGKAVNGISYRATLRYYDAGGKLLDEVVREMFWR